MARKRNLDTATEVGRQYQSERNVVQGGKRYNKPRKPPSQKVQQDPVTQWVPPH